MGYVHTQNILNTECIGNSLDDKINPNFLNLDNAVQFLSGNANSNLTTIITLSTSTNNNFSNLLSTTNTPTVSTFYNTATRNIRSEVRDNSIDYTKVAPGMILNCVNQFTNTAGTFGGTANTDSEITTLTVSISPKLVTSKILIQVMVNGEGNSESVFRLKRTVGANPEEEIGSGSVAGARNTGIAPVPFDTENSTTMGNTYIQFYDSPNSTSNVTYKLYYRPVGNTTFHLNSTVNGSDVQTNERTSSSITLLEVKGA
jgi:hypothetical protein